MRGGSKATVCGFCSGDLADVLCTIRWDLCIVVDIGFPIVLYKSSNLNQGTEVKRQTRSNPNLTTNPNIDRVSATTVSLTQNRSQTPPCRVVSIMSLFSSSV